MHEKEAVEQLQQYHICKHWPKRKLKVAASQLLTSANKLQMIGRQVAVGH